MNRLARFVTGLGVMVLTAGVPTLAEPPIPIDGPTVITEPGYYLLTRDVTGDIPIEAGDVTVDLNGFMLTGRIGASYWRHVRVTNGNVNGRVYAEYCDPTPPLTGNSTFQIDHLTVVNRERTPVSIKTGQGLPPACRVFIEDNEIVGSYRAIRIDGGRVRIARNSIVADNQLLSVTALLDSEISHNYFTGGFADLSGLRDSVIRHNRFCGGRSVFISTAVRNTLESNVSDGSIQLGTLFSGYPTRDNQIRGNTVSRVAFWHVETCDNIYSNNRVFPDGVYDEPGCNIDGGGNVFAPVCEPRQRAYWHRQCLGVSEADGGIDPGRRGRGPKETIEPGFREQLVPCAEMAGLPGCEVIEPNPPSDPCARAEAELAALTFNKLSPRLQDECGVDLRPEGCEAATVGELMEEASTLILSGGRRECRLAAQCLAAVNQGIALTVPGRPGAK